MQLSGSISGSLLVAMASEREFADAGVDAVRERVIDLHNRHRIPLFRYLRSFGLADSDCEEVIQEVFLALFRHLLQQKPGHNLQAWLFQVARNQMMKKYSRRSQEVDLAWAADALDGHPDPEQQVMRAQHQHRIAAVVAALPEQDRECLVLRSEGFRYRDIASIQGRSLASIAIALKRSLAKISAVYRS